MPNSSGFKWLHFEPNVKLLRMKKLTGILMLLALMACDKIENPLKPVILECGDCVAAESDPFIIAPNVLIEEFTGHQCNNCPLAAQIAKDIIAAKPAGRVYTIGIHAGPFANINADYPTDFTTPEGDELYQFANPFGVPVGMVNRVDFGTPEGNIFYTKWEQKTDAILQNTTAQIGMLLDVAVDTITRELCFTAKFKAMEDLSGTKLRWSAFITEGKIKAVQKMPDNSKNKDYIHEHVLRAAINGTFGSDFQDFTGTKDQVTCETRSYILSPDWVIEHCEVVVFVHKNETDNQEIVQVLAAKL